MRLGLTIEPQEARSRFQPDSGPPRSAVHSTARPRLWTPPPMLMGATQLGLFRTFAETTLFMRQRAFEWTNPTPGYGVATFQFVAPHVERWIQQATPLPSTMPGNQVYRAGGAASQIIIEVTFQLWELPWNPSS